MINYRLYSIQLVEKRIPQVHSNNGCSNINIIHVRFSFFGLNSNKRKLICIDPNEADKQELMEKTKMSLAQITVWFTNARVKMRKENKLPLNLYAKKKKKKTQDDSFQLEDTLSPPFAGQNLSFNGRIYFSLS